MYQMDKMYSFSEIGLIPAVLSNISSRKEISVNLKDRIFVSPMTCILDEYNIKSFEDSQVSPILPVTHTNRAFAKSYAGWKAVSQIEAEQMLSEKAFSNTDKIVIDCAHGQRTSLLELVKRIKVEYPNVVIMTGNIITPATYLEYCQAGVDYVRVGIGGGSGCLTSVLSGFHASIPWILTEINRIRKTSYDYQVCPTKTKIVADGGINTIDKVIKAFALGADCVMMGKMFAQTRESCGHDVYDVNGNRTNEKIYYGQASIQGQLDRFGEVKNTPEGTKLKVPVEYSLEELCIKIESVLRTAMSYANAQTLDEFIGNVQWEIQTSKEFKDFIK